MTKSGELERAVMDLVWASPEPMTVRHVMESLAPDRPLAYTTVQTVMDRLAHKGLLLRRAEGKANAYSPARSQEDHTAAVMQEILYGAADTNAALLHFVELIDEQQEHALRQALARRKRARRS